LSGFLALLYAWAVEPYWIEVNRLAFVAPVSKPFKVDISPISLVKAGLAWHFKRYSSDKVLAAEEEAARKAQRGLWAMPNPVPPWDFRKAHPRPHGRD
jgi:endonuclease YncB( thermonuclease family)